MKRTLIVLVAGATLVSVTGLPAQADSPTLDTSYAAAAKINPGSGITPTVNTGGAIGGLLDFITPVLDGVVDPLTSQLSALPSTLVSDLALGLANGMTANSPTTPQSPPASGYPDCSSGGWSSDDCFGPVVPNISALPLMAVGTGTLQGYAAADSGGGYAKAQAAGVILSALGVPIGNLGLAQSSSQCLTANRVCSANATLTGVSLFGGTVTAQTGSDGTLQVALNGGSYASVSTYSSPTTLNVAGLSAVAQAQGTQLQVNVGLSLDQLLSTLGVASLASVNATDAGSTIYLTVTIGANTSTSTDSAAAWGIEVGLGLQADIEISVLGLATVGVGVVNSAPGNLFDLQLAYTSADNSAPADPSGAPPNLT